MSIPSTVLSLLKPVLEHRLKAYAETAAEDSALLARNMRRRLVGAAVAVTGALLGLILGSAWIVGTVWNTPWRNPVLAALLGIFLVGALIGAALAIWPVKVGQGPFARLRSQVGTDVSLLCAIFGSSGSQPTRGNAALGQLMPGGGGPDPGGTFPRSTLMRVVLGFSGLARFLR